MFTAIPLYELSVGGSAKVISLSEDVTICKRFRELGIIEGTEIKKVLISPLGDPSAYLIRGAVIAIRKADAGAISVKSNPSAVMSLAGEALINEAQ